MDRQVRRRRRPALSCVQCRQRKIKCDRKSPCVHCTCARLQCTYTRYSNGSVVGQESQPGASGGTTSSSSLQTASPLVRAKQTSVDRPIIEGSHQQPEAVTTVTTERIYTPNTVDCSDRRSQNQDQDAEPDIHNLLRRVQKLEESSGSSQPPGSSPTGQQILPNQSGLQDSQIFLNKTRVLTWSHWLGRAEEFATIGACYSEVCGIGKEASFQGGEVGTLIGQTRNLLQKCKSIARAIKVGRPSRCLSYPPFDLAPPARDVADTMVSLYFQSFESAFRIFHRPTFWHEYQIYWNDPESASNDLRLKILLVIGIGSSLRGDGHAEDGFRNTVLQWIYAAQSWLSGPLEKDRLDIAGLQIHCLAILARQIFSIGGDLVWTSMGSLIHSAMQIGLHRDPKHLPPKPLLQAELRRRLWATILELIVQSSLDSAMPPRISFDEFDTEAPSNINDDEIDEATRELQPHPKGTYTEASIQLILLDSLPTRLRILQLLNSLKSEVSYLDVLGLSSEMTKACQAYSCFMKDNGRSNVTPFHRNMLDYLVRRFTIPLHCPFTSKARSNPLFYYSLKASLDTALAIMSPEPDEGFSHLMAIGGGLFREGSRCAITVISLELLSQVKAQRLNGTLHRDSRYTEMLKQVLKDVISFSLERIRQGETNIKSHMFLSMIMAQVEAMEVGVSCEFKIAQSAKDSVELCHDLLRKRVGTDTLSYPSDTCITSTSFGSGQEGSNLDLDLEFFFSDTGFS